MLIRVELDVGQEEWFGVKLGRREMTRKPQETGDREVLPCKEANSGETESSRAEAAPRRMWAICHPLQALGRLHRHKKELRQEKERRHDEEQEEKRLMAEWAENLRITETSMEKLAAAIMDLAGGFRDCYCVYDDSIRKWLVGKDSDSEEEAVRMQEIREMQDSILSVLWRRYFPVEEFKGYTQRFWVEQLMPKAVHNHFVILGIAPGLFSVIEQCASKMKSLRWILSEDECNEEVMDFVEDFYMEYGLAIALQPIASWTKENPASLRRLRLVCGQPANILDFTGEACISSAEAAEGSIWLDMLSVEEKQRRITSRNKGIAYFSLKEKWRQAQRSQPFIPACNGPGAGYFSQVAGK